MKYVIIILFLIFNVSALGQFRSDGSQTPSVKEGIVSDDQNYLFGFLNSDNFIMRHSFNVSYSAFAGQGVSLTSYTNSMFYRLMDNLNVQLDLSVVHSPYSTLGDTFQKNISGIYISNAAVNYRPWKDFSVHLQYRNIPYGYGYYNPYYNYYSPFIGNIQNPFKDKATFENE
jgi:hypothetical protein